MPTKQELKDRALPRHRCGLLRDVPGWEGVLLYDPLDIAMDRPLRFYHRFHSTMLGRTIIWELAVCTCDFQASTRKRNPNIKPQVRRRIKFRHKGKDVNLQCSVLTMLCMMGFAIADPRHWVVDHIDGNPQNDRPSNLQVISQRENLLRSEKVQSLIRRIQHLGVSAAVAARRARREKGGTQQ